MGQWAARVREKGLKVRLVMRTGSPHAEIVALATDERDGLVVSGISTSRSGSPPATPLSCRLRSAGACPSRGARAQAVSADLAGRPVVLRT